MLNLQSPSSTQDKIVMTTRPTHLFGETTGDNTADAIYNAIAEARKQPRISDLDLFTKEPPVMRLDGDIIPAGDKPVEEGAINAFITAIQLNEESERNRMRDFGSYSLVHVDPRIGRVRVTVYRSNRVDAIAIRLLGDEPPDLASLSLPPVFDRIATNERGVAILAGPTGAGKTTALAAVVDRINRDRSKKITILEEYPEYVHKSKKSAIRPITIGEGCDAPTYEAALDTTLRNDSDIIIIAEARTVAALMAALIAADLGKRVILTAHIDQVTRFADRIIGAFPGDQQNLVRMLLAGQVQEVVYTELVKRIQPTELYGRIPACEILTRDEGFTAALVQRDSSLTTETALRSYIENGKDRGDCLLEGYLAELVPKTVSAQEARKVVIRPDEFKRLVPGAADSKAGW
jgi:twitching motility protein PilT